jgi:hypothetical protein
MEYFGILTGFCMGEQRALSVTEMRPPLRMIDGKRVINEKMY